MWKVEAAEVEHLRGPGGKIFTQFVDSLIEGEMHFHGIPSSALRTNEKTNIPDGGIDTRLVKPIPASGTGYFGKRTCWQYKAQQHRDVTKPAIVTEMRKKHAAELISKGYRYSFCICDSLSDKKRDSWLKTLLKEARNINKRSPEPQLLTADDLARWASDYPAVVVRFFRPHLESFFHLKSWGDSATELTQQYVVDDQTSQMRNEIMAHVDFTRKCGTVVRFLRGDAGVGKTRFVYEVLKAIDGAKHLVCYTANEEAAMRFASMSANGPGKAILVADECSLATGVRLEDLLRGHKNRVRVICISNTERPLFSGESGLYLNQPKKEVVNLILEQNFPAVSMDSRIQYADLSGGFVRFAVDLCRQHPTISTSGLAASLSSPEEYLRARLDKAQLEVLSAVGLFTKVGFKEDVRIEVETLCQFLDLGRPPDFIKTAMEMKRPPGFVAQAGRYFYVTPEIIARVALHTGWQRWAADDPTRFLTNIPESIVDSFRTRVAKSGTKEVSRIVGDFFREWAHGLTTADLSAVRTARQLITMVETDPDEYLPLLRRLIEESREGDLKLIVGTSSAEGWGPRRHIVWLLERLAWFPEYFGDAEATLLSLALEESEPGIGNNATEVWKQLFRIYLSGTAVSFPDRIRLLESRIFSGEYAVADLAIQALDQLLHPGASRMDTRAVVADRITPEEWQPGSDTGFGKCYSLALNILVRMLGDSDPSLKQRALKILTSNLITILKQGFLNLVKKALTLERLEGAGLGEVVNEIDNFLQFYAERETAEPYVRAVRQWLEELTGGSFHGRLVRVIGKQPWDRSIRGSKDAWNQEIGNLAAELLKTEMLLLSELPWLMSEEARCKDLLGREIGKRDEDAKYIDILVKKAVATGSSGLGAGYVNGLLQNHQHHTKLVNEVIDTIQNDSPRVAYDLFMAGGSSTKDVERVLKLVDAKALPAEFLRGLLYYAAQRTMPSETMKAVLERLLGAGKEGNKRAAGIAVELIAYRLHDATKSEKVALLRNAKLTRLVWDLLDLTVADAAGELVWWFRILEDLIAYADPDQALKLAAAALVSGDINVRREAAKLLGKMAKKFPKEVMKHVGDRIMDKETAWVFFVDTLRELFNSIPLETAKSWLRISGEIGARRLARHLSLPYVDEGGNCVVPELTEYLLSAFEDDEQTFSEFLAGSHSFQWYGGDIGAAMEKEADTAKRFLNHPLRRIREWAVYEIDRAKTMAEEWKKRDEESYLE
jgi:hypothetical protein